jgi:hypothetical protein
METTESGAWSAIEGGISMSGKAVYAGLLAVQRDLKCSKNQYNSFGKYKYRSCEDILQAARPLCNENGLVLTVSDEIISMGARYYVKATSKVTDIATGESVENVAYAREDDTKKGMDAAQITGACSSYARKYSLCGLFAIDDNKDMDTEEYQGKKQETKQSQPPVNNGQDEMRKKALHTLSEKMQKQGILKEEISALAGVYYNKLSTKEMTTNEICDLANNLEKYIAEQTGQTA